VCRGAPQAPQCFGVELGGIVSLEDHHKIHSLVVSKTHAFLCAITVQLSLRYVSTMRERVWNERILITCKKTELHVSDNA
jgi:hypothetical protein